MAKKKDSVQPAFEAGLNALGAVWGDIHEVGGGIPDLFAYFEQTGGFCVIEIKSGPNKPLTTAERNWWDRNMAYGIDDAWCGVWLFSKVLDLLKVPKGSYAYTTAMGAYVRKMKDDRLTVPDEDRDAYLGSLLMMEA